MPRADPYPMKGRCNPEEDERGAIDSQALRSSNGMRWTSEAPEPWTDATPRASDARERSSLVADIARSLVAVAYFAGAAFNLLYTLRHPEVFDSWLESPLLPGYRWFFVDVVAQNAWFWVPLAVAGEIILGVLLLARGRLVRIGIALSIVFQLLLAPMWIGQAFINLLLAVAQVPLLRPSYPQSIPDRLRHLRTRPRGR